MVLIVPQRLSIFNLGGLISGDRATDNAKANEIMDHVSNMIDVQRQDAPTIRATAYATLAAEFAAVCALSLIPFESNFGSVLGGLGLFSMLRPLIEGAIVDPWMEQMHALFPARHLNARILVTMLQEGAITGDQLIQIAVGQGLHDEDVQALYQYAMLKMYDAEVKDDEALLSKYTTTIIDAEIAARKETIDEQIADFKTQLSAAKAALKAGAATFS